MTALGNTTTNPTAARWALGLASLGSFLVVLDMLVVATALTAIRRDLDASLEQLEWTVNAYTLTFAVLLMTAATIGDRCGRRRWFAIGLAVFAAASAACALAPGIGWLIAARVAQGAGAALIAPLGLALLNAAIPRERRGRALGVYGAMTGLAATLGPVLGGAVTQGLSWQWVFWLNVPIAAVAVPLVLRKVPESFGPARPLDLPGLLLVSGAAFGLVWALVRFAGPDRSVGEIVGVGFAGVVLAVGFGVRQRRATDPMLPPRLFRSRAFTGGGVAIFAFNAALTGAIFLTAQLQQVAYGASPLTAGLRLLPWGLVPMLIAPSTGALVDRIGARGPAAGGLLLQGIGTGALALTVSAGVGYQGQVVPMIVIALGFSFAAPAITRAMVGQVQPADIGMAAGAFGMVRQLGGAFGVAAPSAVFAVSGGYASPAAFVSGYGPAMVFAAALALLGAVAALAIPRQRAAAAADQALVTR